MRAFLALAARWERVERWNILGGVLGRLVWFGLVWCDWEVCGIVGDREVWFVLTSGGLEQDLFNEPLIYRNSEHFYTPMYIKKKSQFPLLPYLPVSSSSNKQQKSASS